MIFTHPRVLRASWLGLATMAGLSFLALPWFGSVARAEATPAAPPAETDPAFDLITEQARALAAAPHRSQEAPLPAALAALKYDGHRDIRSEPENFLWFGQASPFRVQFRHRGWLFNEQVALATVSAAGDRVTPLPFSPKRFDYGPLVREALDPATLPEDLGFAGIALHQVAFEEKDGQKSEAYNEIMSLQGGSYFRAIGQGQHWGSSVRALAINTALPEPEEFPRWKQLWIRQPLPEATSITLYGLLEGPSVAGAFRLVVSPGSTLSVEVDGHLFFRDVTRKIGLAPITSMFLFGEEDPARFGDYRPEVHDADTLVMEHADGRVDIRPLRNPRHGVHVSRFRMSNPKGFGLLQRDREFDHYQDLETEMHIRPSIWVSPRGDWGNGWVELLEIASEDEGMDNIGAYWIAETPDGQELLGGAGSQYHLRYRLDFTQEDRPAHHALIDWLDTRTLTSDETPEVGSVVRTARPEDSEHEHVLRVLLDAEPDTALPTGTIVRADVQATRGELLAPPVIQYNRFTHAYRVFFDVVATSKEPVELRVLLRDAEDRPLTTTWLYRWDLP